MTCENIRYFETQCKKLDNVIARELEATPQTLTTVPGIGNVLTAGIVARIGDVTRFYHEKALAKMRWIDLAPPSIKPIRSGRNC